MNVGVPLIFFHYGDREHIDQFFEDGSIQIGTVRAYDTATHGHMIGDDHEGFSWDVITDQNANQYIASGMRIPNGPFGHPIFNRTGSWGNVHVTQNMGFNYAIFCATYILHRELCLDFKSSYNAAIMIERPFPFFHEITKAFSASGLCKSVIFQHVADIRYQNRVLEPGDEVIEAFIKDERYKHQAEVRALWNVGAPTERFFRFKVPEAVRCCRKILLDDMPNYAPGAPGDEQAAMMAHAIRSSTSA